MKIHFNVVGQVKTPSLSEVNLPRVPQLGELVHVVELDIDLYVRTVVWYPWGEPNEEIGEPFVYVVIGPQRPTVALPV